MAKKKIKNTTQPDKKVENAISIKDIDSHLYKNSNLVIDFSFEGAFVSCKTGAFNNYLQDSKEFIEKFRAIMLDVTNLSQKSPNKIFPSGEYKHCHKASYEDTATSIIKEIFNKIGKNDLHFEQEIGGEEIFQIGLQSEVRLFGTVRGNVFRVYFVDYYHDFEYDQRRNERNKKICKFCVINSELN